jgi:hypothetical protein
MRLIRLASVLAVTSGIAVLSAAQPAQADREDLGPCGMFDFSAGLSCKVEVSGGCTAKCSPLQFKAACKGGCTATTTQSNCTNNCGTQCIQQCNPQLLDCFVGCHAECDAPVEQQCTQKGGVKDCKAQAKAQCDMHCESSCKVPPTSCQEHCTSCCTGSCDTQVNFDCDLSCMAKVEGGCNVACTKPEGAIFCNGQYVNATDIKACIAHLATRSIKVDVSASASLNCTGTDCAGTAGVNVPKPGGCDVGGVGPYGWGAIVAVGLTLARRRRSPGAGPGSQRKPSA